MYSVERNIFRCPILSINDSEAYYPEPSEERQFLMSLQCKNDPLKNYVFGDVRLNTVGESYIEILIYNESIFVTNYRRFIIRRGWMMAEKQEAEFVHLCERNDLQIDYDEFAYLQDSISEYIPDIPIRVYAPEEIGSYLLRVYYSTHKSGPKEILYKAGLDKVADLLSSVEDYNMIGNSPREILGIPITLARILNQAELIDRLRTAESRRTSVNIYRKFSSFFGKNDLPNRFQWMYLEKISQDEKIRFEKILYQRLNKCTKQIFEYYIEYVDLRRTLGKYNPYKKYLG